MLVAGCVQGPGTQATTGNGLEITSLTGDQTTVYSTKNLRVFMDVENQGDYQILSGNALAYLISSWNFDSSTSAIQKISKDLNPADPVRGTPAGADRLIWTLTAPTLSAGQSRTDTMIGRAYYKYKTVVSGSFWAYSEAEETASRDRGETLEKLSSTSTVGPVEATVSIAPDPVVVGAGEETFTMSVVLKNTGGGTIFKNDAIDMSASSPSVSLNEDQLNIVKISTSISGTSIEITGDECNKDQELIGNSITLICDVKVKQAPAAKLNYPFTVTLDYGYYKDQKLSVEARGR
jgi:hypothetical protein